ncbi:hypothetical protein C4J97_3120 [Pseudomonas orientalis]|nr:hypothetical protein C4J97_3120 [Pseudomonas orientalis]
MQAIQCAVGQRAGHVDQQSGNTGQCGRGLAPDGGGSDTD